MRIFSRISTSKVIIAVVLWAWILWVGRIDGCCGNRWYLSCVIEAPGLFLINSFSWLKGVIIIIAYLVYLPFVSWTLASCIHYLSSKFQNIKIRRVVMIVLFILVLGLFFIPLGEKKSCAELREEEQQRSVEPAPAPPTEENPITVSRNDVVIDRPGQQALKVGLYNPSEELLTAVVPSISCPYFEGVVARDNIKPFEMSVNPRDIPSKESNTFIVIISVSDEAKEGKGICTIEFEEFKVAKDITLTVRK